MTPFLHLFIRRRDRRFADLYRDSSILLVCVGSPFGPRVDDYCISVVKSARVPISTFPPSKEHALIRSFVRCIAAIAMFHNAAPILWTLAVVVECLFDHARGRIHKRSLAYTTISRNKCNNVGYV